MSTLCVCVIPRLLQVGCASICITTWPVFWAPPPRSACWLSVSSSAKWAASWGEGNSCSFVAQTSHPNPSLDWVLTQTFTAWLLCFYQRYLSELCCVDGPVGAGHTTFPVVSILLSVNGNTSATVAVSVRWVWRLAMSFSSGSETLVLPVQRSAE